MIALEQKALLASRIRAAIASGDDKAIKFASLSALRLGQPKSAAYKRKMQGKAPCAATMEAARQAHLGSHPSEEARAKMSAAGKGKPKSAAHNAAVSAALRAGFAAGTITPNNEGGYGKQGDFYSAKNSVSIHWRSESLELRWYEQLEQDVEVKSFKPGPVIPYIFNGVLRSYFSDLLIHYHNGRVKLVEFKPEQQWKDEQNIAKWRYAKAWCKIQTGEVKFEVWGYLALAQLAQETELRPVVAGPAVDVAADQAATGTAAQQSNDCSVASSLALPDDGQAEKNKE